MRFSVFLTLLVALLPLGCSRQAETDSRLLAPTELWAARPSGGDLFANPGAVAALRSVGENVGTQAESTLSVLDDPSAWRQLDRRERFDGALLAGQPAETSVLARHLFQSPDFRLERLDNWGFLFSRKPPSTYRPPSPESVVPDLTDSEQRADYLAAVAVNLDTIGEFEAARDYLSAAQNLAPDAPLVLGRKAYIDLQHQRHAAAVAAASQALEKDPDSALALEIAAQSFAAVGAVDRAWQVAERLLAISGTDDPRILFLHARLASDAHAYSREQDSLEKLVALTEKAGRSTTTFRVYLGQSYARQSLPRPALEQFETALEDPDLGPSQRADLESTVANIREKTGIE
jgi:tetratricopeptide (TPR) repeat protein